MLVLLVTRIQCSAPELNVIWVLKTQRPGEENAEHRGADERVPFLDLLQHISYKAAPDRFDRLEMNPEGSWRASDAGRDEVLDTAEDANS